jgi:hypothetical protein
LFFCQKKWKKKKAHKKTKPCQSNRKAAQGNTSEIKNLPPPGILGLSQLVVGCLVRAHPKLQARNINLLQITEKPKPHI